LQRPSTTYRRCDIDLSPAELELASIFLAKDRQDLAELVKGSKKYLRLRFLLDCSTDARIYSVLFTGLYKAVFDGRQDTTWEEWLSKARVTYAQEVDGLVEKMATRKKQ